MNTVEQEELTPRRIEAYLHQPDLEVHVLGDNHFRVQCPVAGKESSKGTECRGRNSLKRFIKSISTGKRVAHVIFGKGLGDELGGSIGDSALELESILFAADVGIVLCTEMVSTVGPVPDLFRLTVAGAGPCDLTAYKRYWREVVYPAFIVDEEEE